MLDEVKYFEAIDLVKVFYQGNFEKISHLIRVSLNPNLINFDERIAALLYPTIHDNKITQNDLETQFNEFVANIVSRIMPYSDEDEYTYIDRINKDKTLSKIKFCILSDEYYIESYNQKKSLKNLANIKYDITINSFGGFGIPQC